MEDKMLIDPELYISFMRDKTYEELIDERDILLGKIREYEEENQENLIVSFGMSPSRELVYIHNYLYLSKLCELIAEKYKY